jgi:glycosyltransferase involved in cell wall biosynthesis
MNIISPRISVIVPIYKVELYLSQCIESILKQTYKNLEVILVNDGSPDNCADICNEYANIDSRIIMINKENGGLSDARNTGINIATGEYLIFVDSDDWIEIDMIELLYNNLNAYNADISMCNYFSAYKNNIIPLTSLSEQKELILLNSEEAIEQCFKGEKFDVSAWGKLYKKHIFNKIRYPLNKYCEDCFIIIDILSRANIIIGEAAPKYYYRQRKSSIMNNLNIKRIMDEIESWENNLKIVEEKHDIKSEIDLYNICKIRLLKVILSIFSMILPSKFFASIISTLSVPLYKAQIT